MRNQALLAISMATVIFAMIFSSPVAAQTREPSAGIRSDAMLLLPLAAPANPDAVSILIMETAGEVPVRFGAMYSFKVGSRVALTAQAAVGHRTVESTPFPGNQTNDGPGWYPAAGFYADWSFASTATAEFGALIGGEVGYYPASDGAWRFVFPLGVRTESTWQIGSMRVSPAVAAGLALTHDVRAADAPTEGADEGAVGWFLELSPRVGLGPVWTEIFWGVSERIGGELPPDFQRTAAKYFGLRFGMSLGDAD